MLRHDGAAAQTVWPERIVRQPADGERRSDFDFTETLHDGAKRRAGDSPGQGLVAALNLARTRVVAVVLEDAGPVLQPVLEKAAVRHDADVARGRKIDRAERSIDE